ncbi:hypothetical protein RZN05_15135 [Sphingomonas sp. HF-S4]|uniref:Uncharacterized protein n=1 Tax=Sphingomonas agrestis TaxID=3080540 RepID=A0ABU3YA85_9SPHN|nr:hypothetical protein [Sphingomonas sp. HF-S4]MDV3458330.1 hypothetical protein [Sphingomonas sp. HF-S4]
MCSVRRLARMLASLAPPRPDGPSSERPAGAGHREDFLLLPSPALVVQKGGTERGTLARLDSLGLVVRVKRDDAATCLR